MAKKLKIGKTVWVKISKKDFEQRELDLYNGSGMHYCNKVVVVPQNINPAPAPDDAYVLRITNVIGAAKKKRYTSDAVLVRGTGRSLLTEYCERITTILRMDDASDQTDADRKIMTKLVRRIIRKGEFYVPESEV